MIRMDSPLVDTGTSSRTQSPDAEVIPTCIWLCDWAQPKSSRQYRHVSFLTPRFVWYRVCALRRLDGIGRPLRTADIFARVSSLA
jgi:hypothetical protein